MEKHFWDGEKRIGGNMEKFIQILKDMGVCFGTGRVDDKYLRVVVTDDSFSPIADFWFEDTDAALLHKVQSGSKIVESV